MGIVAPDILQHSAAPFADAAQLIWGNWAGGLIAIGAAIACFGALNGWILLQGQLPLAAARENLSLPVFRVVSKKGIPVTGIIFASVLSSVLVSLNYSKGLVEMFSFIIMLATLSCLISYLFSSITEIVLYLKKKKQYNRRRLITAATISIPAFIYSLWAITGLEKVVIIWGALLLASGIPIYAYIKYSKRKR